MLLDGKRNIHKNFNSHGAEEMMTRFKRPVTATQVQKYLKVVEKR
jgi:hypothetical protein